MKRFFLVVVILLVAVVGYFLLGRGQDGEGAVVNCDNEQCFQEHFAECAAARYTDQMGANFDQVQLTVRGWGDADCRVELLVEEASVTPEWEGESMECVLDNSINYRQELVFTLQALEAGEEVDCRGPLVERFEE